MLTLGVHKKGLTVLAACALAAAGALASPVVSDRLSNPDVKCFAKDSLGRMWIGTERGLNRYNGYDFHQYFHFPDSLSIPDNRIYDLCADSLGRLWVGTEDGVALYCPDDTFRRIPIDSEERAVYQVLCDREGRIILNMQEDICVYDSLSNSFVKAVPGFDRYFSYHSVCRTGRDGLLWVVAPHEIRCFDPSRNFANIDNWPCLHPVTESVMLSDGRIWMAGYGYFSIFDTNTRSFPSIPPSLRNALGGLEVRILWEAADGLILIKSSDGGFHLLDCATDKLTPLPKSRLDIPDGFETSIIYRDSSGDVWMGSDDKGFVFRSGLDGFPSAKNPGESELSGKSVVSMSTAADGRLWLFTRHDGLYLYDPSTGLVEHPDLSAVSGEGDTDYLQLNEPLVFAASNGDLWLSLPHQQRLLRCAYDGGMVRLKSAYPAFYPRVMLEDAAGGIWVGTRNEFLMHFQPGSDSYDRIQIYPFRTTFINCLCLLGDNILVGAYDNQLAILNVHTHQAHTLAIPQETASSGSGLFEPTAFHSDHGGNIWIGTRYGGLLKYNPTERTISKVSGSSESEIVSIEEDSSGRIWAGTGNGLAIYDPSDSSYVDFISATGREAESFHERSSASLPGGLLAFGGPHGLSLVDPSEPQVQAGVTPVFEDLKVHNQIVRPGDRTLSTALSACPQIRLDHGSNSFGISFAAPDYRNISRVRYSYKLDGFNKEWVEAGGAREAYFSNVPAGRYTLRVRYHLHPFQDKYMENSIPVKVSPSPWLSWEAKVLYALALLLIVWTVFRLRRRILQEKEAVREAQAAKEQEARVNSMNMTFFSNISHEFRTPLTMISGPISELARSGRLSGEDRHLVSIVQRSVSRMLSLAGQLMDLGKIENSTLTLKVSKADIVPVINDTAEIFTLNAKSLGIAMDLRGLEYPLRVWFDKDKVEKILTNLLSNALKFTPAGGNVTVELDEIYMEGEHFVKVTVSDTGPGIPEDQREKIFDRYYQLDNSNKGRYNYGTGIGLFYSRSLATIHHGELRAGGREDGPGSVFTLLIPAEESSYSTSERIVRETPVSGEYPIETTTGDEIISSQDGLPVLLAVDDDPDIIRYLQALFAARYKVLWAYSADEAMKIASEQAPDIVLSDVAMPGKSGFDLCSELKSNLQLCHIPVILVTAMGTVQQQVHGLDSGADAYVTKPFDPDYLKALVKSQLENRQRVRGLINSATESSEVESLSARDRAFMDELYSLMEKELGNEDLDISRLTEMLKMSRTKFYYKIKGLTGKTPSEFFMQYKLNMAAKMLSEGKLNVSEIAVKTGFNTLPHFSKAFKKQFGVSPSKYGA